MGNLSPEIVTGPLLTLAIILIAGVLFGHLAGRFHLPSVTGQILIGILLGPYVLSVVSLESLEGLQPITHFALGLIAVTVGSHLNLPRLRNAVKRLSLLILFEATITPVLVFLTVIWITGGSYTLGALLAAMAVSTAPATVVAIVSETRSKGVFVKTLMAGVALNNIVCIGLFEIAHTASTAALLPLRDPSLLDLILPPIQELVASALLGVLAGIALIAATRRVLRSDRLATASMIAILLTAGVADLFEVSPLLACLFLGVTLANLTPNKEEVGHHVFSDFESAIFAVFFTLAGMELNFRYLLPAGLLAAAVFFARSGGKLMSARIAMGFAGAPDRVRRYLGFGLIPQAGVAVGLMILVQEDPALLPIRDLFLAVGITTVTLNEIVGPILLRFALGRAGEIGKDRARLIDFLHEENIITDLRADTKEEAIGKLTDLLISSHHLKLDRQKFLDSILEKERAEPTEVGDGLAIPHGELPDGGSLVGVMGISREGLGYLTPDGTPIHCMVLLATPVTERDRHLEVLAALARAVSSDRNIQRQLFHAKSPAHAYEILHAEEFEDFNYFLESED